MSETAWIIRDLGDAKPWQLADALRAQMFEGVIEVFPALESVGVETSHSFFPPALDLDCSGERAAGRSFELPVCFDALLGEDLSNSCSELGLAPSELIRHLELAKFEVAAIGFIPGFPYLTGLPAQLQGLPRRPSPRISVPRGSFAITGNQAGIYPSVTPGGWRLLGQTPYELIDLEESWFALQAGDNIRIASIDLDTYTSLKGQRLLPQ